jgi:alpha-tubulin suppressor-like RCC1 family protein
VNVDGKAVQMAAGATHACLRMEGGSVQCWGNGDWGTLGYGDTEDRPVSTRGENVDLGGRAVDIAAGHALTCAVLEGGQVRCWGSGQGGRLGTGSIEDVGDDETPSSVEPVPLGGPATQVAIGLQGHACALLEDGSVRCWGQNLQGEIGDPKEMSAIGDDESPATRPPVDVGGKVAEIQAGGAFTCARLVDGNVRCWGMAASGRLGYPNRTKDDDAKPPSMAGNLDLGGRAVQIDLGQAHACAVLEGGKLRCWGSSAGGQLGYGNSETIGDNEAPASAGDVDVGGTVAQLSVGGDRTCVLLDSGGVRCWGRNKADRAGGGHLGYERQDNIGDDETPASVGDIALF